ncbi:MAG: serine/threonine protein kinase [Bacteroidota bacterium]
MKKDDDATFAWGDDETQFFYELTPDIIFTAVESLGYRCTGRCLPLNSMENRVLEVEVDVEKPIHSESERFRIVKFYRPHRWSDRQLSEEHLFLKDLEEGDVPVVRPETDTTGQTLFKLSDLEIYFCVYPKVGGRNPDELNRDQLTRIGRLLARLHNIGDMRSAKSRITLNPTSYGLDSLDYLLEAETLPISLEDGYADTVEEICEKSEKLFSNYPTQRVHGDCHLGNLLWSPSGPFWVDFDDLVNAPCVQDVWLLVPGRDRDSINQREVLLDAYQGMRTFDRSSLQLIEPLRALRFIHFNAWIAKRWQDPAFPRVFPEFGTNQYWNEQIQDLKECLQLIKKT